MPFSEQEMYEITYWQIQKGYIHAQVHLKQIASAKARGIEPFTGKPLAPEAAPEPEPERKPASSKPAPTARKHA